MVRIGALRDHEQHGGVLGRSQELLAELQGGRVGPMHVLEHDHDGPCRRQPLE